MPVKPRIKFSPGKTYVYTGTEGTYSVIAGELLEGDAVPSGGNLSYGNGAPGSGSGKDGDVYLDLTDFKIHTKSAGSWGSGAAFKGANGLNGSNGINGTNGNRIRWGNGAPSNSDGVNDDLYIDLSDFKIHTKGSGSWGVGNAFKGPAGVKGATLLQGSGLPGSGDGDDGDSFLDVTNHIVYKKSGGVWAAQGSSFKGSKGSDGLRGKVTLEGAGEPGTGTNLATPTAALTDALTDASLTSGDLAVGDLYLDTTNHRFYKKTALGWATRGLSFVGPAGDKGDTGSTGATGPGVLKFSCGLTADTYISTGATQSTPTTAGSTVVGVTYPATLRLTDNMEDVGGIVTRTDVKYQKNSSDTLPFDLTGSKFTINTAGRYKIEFNATFNVQASSSSANSVDLTAFIDYSTDDGVTYTTMVSQTATMTTASTTAAQTTLELTKTLFLPVGTTIFFKAKRGGSTVSTVVSVNAIVKSEVGDDTFVVITKL